MIISVPENAIHKRIAGNVMSSVQLYMWLKEHLDSRGLNIFAEFSASNNHFKWTLPGSGWKRITEVAEEALEKSIRGTLDSKKLEIEKALSPIPPEVSLEKVWSVPSDDYIYYRVSESGVIEVMLVAWDYQTAARHGGEGISFRLHGTRQSQSVRMRFVEIGRPVPGYPFFIRTKDGKFNEKITDGDGSIFLGALPVGNTVEAMSTDKSRDFSFEVIKGQTDYEFDITGPVRVEVYVTRDGRADVAAPIYLKFADGQLSSCNNPAVFKLPYKEGQNVSAYVDENYISNERIDDFKSRTYAERPLEYPVTRLELSMVSSRPVADIDVTSILDGQPSSGDEVYYGIGHSGMEPAGITDRTGHLHLHFEFFPGDYISVRIGDEIKTQPLREGEVRFVFERVSPPLPPEPEYYNIRLRLNDGEFPASVTATLMLESGGVDLLPGSDGIFRLDKNSVRPEDEYEVRFVRDDYPLGTMNIMFSPTEDDYQIDFYLKKKCGAWNAIKQIIVALLTAFMLYILLSLFVYLLF